jgi:C-terminal processing protease CtpA/Prc
MMRILVSLLLLLGAAQAQETGLSFDKLFELDAQKAHQLYEQKDYAGAATLLEELHHNPQLLLRSEDERINLLYNLACYYSLAGDKAKALEALEEAVDAGLSQADYMAKDADLSNIRTEARFKELLAEVEARNRVEDTLWRSPALHTEYHPDLTEDEKVAGLSLLWSEAKYNFPYFERLPTLDWDATYLAYLPKARATKSTFDYYKVLQEFYAQLHDGHTTVLYPSQLYDLVGSPPITTRLIEDKVLIENVWDPSLKEKGIVAGLEIVAVDGIPVMDYGNRFGAPLTSASSPQDLAHRVFEGYLLSGPKDSPVELTLRDAAGNTQKATLRRLTAGETQKLSPIPVSRFAFKMLSGGIAYVALNTFQDEGVDKDFDAAFPEIEKSNALILDLRENGGGNGGIGYRILSYLTEKPFLTPAWSTRDYRPAYRAWGRIENTYRGEPDLVQPHGGTAYTRPVVVLTSGGTYSGAEAFVVAFDSMQRGAIIGEPTGGLSGSPLSFPLPGGGSATVCSTVVRYPNGKEYEGVGIQPNVLVHPTIADFRAGRDTVLSAAVDYLTRKN